MQSNHHILVGQPQSGKNPRLVLRGEFDENRMPVEASTSSIRRSVIVRNHTLDTGELQRNLRLDDTSRNIKNSPSQTGIQVETWRIQPTSGRVRLPNVTVGIKKEELFPFPPPARRMSSQPKLVSADTENVWMRSLWIQGVPGVSMSKPTRSKVPLSNLPASGCNTRNAAGDTGAPSCPLTALSITPTLRAVFLHPRSGDSSSTDRHCSDQEPPLRRNRSTCAHGDDPSQGDVSPHTDEPASNRGSGISPSVQEEQESNSSGASINTAKLLCRWNSSRRRFHSPASQASPQLNAAIDHNSEMQNNPPPPSMKQSLASKSAFSTKGGVRTDEQQAAEAQSTRGRKKSTAKIHEAAPKTNALAKFAEFVLPSDEQWLKARKAAADYARGSPEEQALHESALSQFKCENCMCACASCAYLCVCLLLLFALFLQHMIRWRCLDV
jgi:hypothetical protein